MNILTYIKNKLKEAYDKSDSSGNSSNGGAPSVPTTEDKLNDLSNFIDSQYSLYLPDKASVSTPEPPKYERYEYDAPSDESIQQSAEDELSDYLNSNESSIKNQYDQKAKELEANRAANEKLYEDSAQKLKEAYGEAAEKLSNDALKRGLARSSIAANNQAAASKAFAEGANELIAQRNEKISALDDEINSLSGQLQSALDSFKISYAAKLTARINELKSEREKRTLEALKYNNSLLSDEFEQELKKEKTDSDLYSDAIDEAKRIQSIKNSLTEDQQDAIDKSIFDKMVEILDSMTKEEAMDAIETNPIFRRNLSEFRYYKLRYRYK